MALHGRLHDSLGNLHFHLLLGIFGLDLGNLLLFLLFELLALGRIVASLLNHLVILLLRDAYLVVRLCRVVRRHGRHNGRYGIVGCLHLCGHALAHIRGSLRHGGHRLLMGDHTVLFHLLDVSQCRGIDGHI